MECPTQVESMLFVTPSHTFSPPSSGHGADIRTLAHVTLHLSLCAPCQPTRCFQKGPRCRAELPEGRTRAPLHRSWAHTPSYNTPSAFLCLQTCFYHKGHPHAPRARPGKHHLPSTPQCNSCLGLCFLPGGSGT